MYYLSDSRTRVTWHLGCSRNRMISTKLNPSQSCSGNHILYEITQFFFNTPRNLVTLVM